MNGMECNHHDCLWNDDGECMIHDEDDKIRPGDNCEYEESENEW